MRRLAVRSMSNERSTRRRLLLDLAAIFLAVSVAVAASAVAETRDGMAGSQAPEGKVAPPPSATTPPLREDEPGSKGGVAPGQPDSDEGMQAPPFSGGCPYRGRKLELIV